MSEDAEVVGARVGKGLQSLSSFGSGSTKYEILAIIATAVVVIGGLELLLRWFEVPQYILPTPSQIAVALVTDFPLILPHPGYHLSQRLRNIQIICQGP